MCVAAFAWQAHPRWRIAMIGNRDEFHARPSAPLAPWDDHPGIIAGRDRVSGGTWLGVSRQGRIALVTNRRGFGGPDPARISRGRLVADLLLGKGRYADPQTAALEDFNPFSLLLADAGTAWFLGNRPDTVRARLKDGIHALSNGALDEPWPKVVQLRAALADWLAGEADNVAPLFAALACDRLPADDLPARASVQAGQEAARTAVFIRDPVYGTRCSTVCLIDGEGSGQIIERRFDPDGRETGESRFAFSWPAARSETALREF